MSEYTYQLERLIFSSREVDFILQNLEMDGHSVVTPNDADYLKKICTERAINTSSKHYFDPKAYLVPNDSIRWFKDDLRVTLWFYAFLVIEQQWSMNLLSVHNIFTKDFALSFDCHFDHRGLRTNTLRNFLGRSKTRAIKIAFPYFSKCKTSRDHLRWLNENNKEQINWALDYLQEKKLLINAPNFTPTNTKECYAQVCASLDALDMHSDLQQKLIDSYPRESKKTDKPDQTMTNGKLDTPRETTLGYRDNPEAFKKIFKDVHEASDAKRELLTRMRTAWNQKVFREKNPVKAEKKTKLPHGYEKKVKEISEAYGEDMVACLKRIIDEEHNTVKPDG